MVRGIFGTILGAALLLGGATGALAQSATSSGKPAVARSTAPAPARKPPTAAKPVAAPSYSTNGEPGRLSDYWTIERALPDPPHASRPLPAQPQLGRVPLQNAPGTIGFDAREMRSTTFSDGRPVPGLTQNTTSESSAVGLSLTVPSNSNSFVIPLLQPPGSPNGW